jgi:hypothetical protein
MADFSYSISASAMPLAPGILRCTVEGVRGYLDLVHHTIVPAAFQGPARNFIDQRNWELALCLHAGDTVTIGGKALVVQVRDEDGVTLDSVTRSDVLLLDIVLAEVQ